jgi:hypothetical protein
MSAACAICGFLGILIGGVMGVVLMAALVSGRSDDD